MSKIRFFTLVAFLLTCLVIPIFSNSQPASEEDYQATLTPWGHPDLQGVWDRRTITPLQRPERFAGKAFLNADEIAAYETASAARNDGRSLDSGRSGITVHDPDDLDYGDKVLSGGQTSLVVDPPNGLIPALTEAAQMRAAERAKYRASRGPADSWTDRSLAERCLTWGVPQGMLPQAYKNNIQILQTPNEVLILNEIIHDIRIVPLDDKPHLPSSVRQWHGDPRGHWLGNTLVVKSTNFSSQSSFRGAAENLQLEERFTRLGDEQLLYEFTVEDSTTWEQAWSVSFPMVMGDQPIYEFACHEGNHGLYNILRVARALENQAAQ
tara:strand:+ start:25377 stop:26348 length:972 start_codon:yes stop_codon:yes gene_type:complete